MIEYLRKKEAICEYLSPLANLIIVKAFAAPDRHFTSTRESADGRRVMRPYLRR